jgi:tripartite-type tricarboxylate transporter receptor subunit TctC
MKKIFAVAALSLVGSLSLGQTTSEAISAFRPTKPVTLVIPYSPGGGTDVIGRLFAKHLSEKWGQSVIVDNRAGANGTIGSNLVAKAAQDGTSLLLVVSSIAINPFVMGKLPYDTQTAFTPITPLAYSVVVLVGSPKLPVNDMRGFASVAKKAPSIHTFASSETATRVQTERIFEAANIKLTHIPYKGASQWLTDVMAGNVDVGLASVTSAQPFLKDGRIKILGIAGESRSELLPTVPTFKEQGISGLEVHSWYGLFAPGGTPTSVVKAIHSDIQKVLAQPEVKARIASLGALPGGDSPEAFNKRFHADIAESGELVRRLGIIPE